MDHFTYQQQQLHAEAVPITAIVERFGSPCYIYSRATLERHWHAFDDAFAAVPHLICYAAKANSNLAVLNCLARLGSGFDIVSGGELQRVLTAGGDPAKVVFSGVGKTSQEMQQALAVGIKSFNVESRAELERLNNIAGEMQQQAPVALRVNPDIDAKTHPYISTGLKENKFGIPLARAKQCYLNQQLYPNIRFVGLDCHIGSQLTELEPMVSALHQVLAVIDELADQNIMLEYLDLGGGLGVRYKNELPPHPSEYAAAILEPLQAYNLELILEPGRAIAANAGILVTRVDYLKDNQGKHFAIVDAAMNDLLRPALYQAYQDIIPVQQNSDAAKQHYDVVGPICESGDFLGKDRELSITVGDLLAVRSAGAYGFSMSSNYNSRPRVAEIMVDGDQVHLVRQRESIEDLYALEQVISDADQL